MVRLATRADIPALMRVRYAVTEKQAGLANDFG